MSDQTKATSEQAYLLPNGRVLRYSFRERLMHWLAGFSYIYLLLTGLAFWSPWLFWITVLLGGPTIARELHPWAGVIFTVAVVWMYRVWSAQMHTTERDRQWWRALPHYIRNEDEEVPSEGRFNGGQKALFWGFLWCGIVLFLSGLVLWEPHWIPWSLRALRLIAVIVHPIAALITIALFIVHVYMGTAVERGAFGSIIRGDVPRWWAARYHRAWYEQVSRDAPAKAPAEAPARE
jgi:formate dehydrogenase subunit gamma